MTDSARVWFYATPPSTPLHPFDVFHAQALNSSLGQADLLVKYAASTETTFPRSVYVTTPYPVFRGTNATFGVIFANSAENTTITNVTIAIPGGYDFEHNRGLGAPLFQTGWTVATEDGTWTGWDAKHASWTGSRAVESLGAASWFVDVPITDDPSVVTSIDNGFRNLPEVNATFANGFSATSTRWGAVPGILRLDVPNASVAAGPPPHDGADGYPHTGATTFDLQVKGSTARAHVGAVATYDVGAASSDVVQLQSSVANSSFNVSPRIAPLGRDVTLAGDLQSVLTTLAQQGVTDANLTLDLYAPPSLGCVPTASWTWSAGSLPVAPLNDVRVWHAGGLVGDVVFAASHDGHVYEVLPGGLAGWQFAPAAEPVKLALGEWGGATRLFVGDARGGVTALDPTHGTQLWRTTVGGSLLPVATLLPNATTGRILVAAGATVARLDPADAAVLVSAQVGTRVVQAADAADGGAFVLATVPGAQGAASALDRLSPAFDVTRTAPDNEGLGFAVGAMGVVTTKLVANGYAPRYTLLLDPDDLETVSEVPDPGRAALAGSGDATGDGVDDLLLAYDDATLRVIDGATGSTAWSFDPHGLGGEVHEPRPLGDLYAPSSPGEMPVPDCGATLETFSQDYRPDGPFALPGTSCVTVTAGGLQAQPSFVGAAQGRVVYAYGSQDSVGVLMLFGSGGNPLWRKAAASGAVPTSATLDAYDGAPALVVGAQDGTVDAFAAQDGATLLATKPAAGVGRFSFRVHVPMGGFFGTHLAVATLAWTQGGAAQSAHLMDWFEVVQPDGTPVTHPSYRVAMVVQDRAHPNRET